MIALVKTQTEIIDEIDYNLSCMEENERENLALVLCNGRLLHQIKDATRHGQWLPFLESTRYAGKAREAQKHMQIWRRWSGRIERLVQAGVLAPVNPERDWVNRLSSGQVNVALSVIYALTPVEIPDSALDIALAVLEQDGKLEAPQLSELIESAKIVDTQLPAGNDIVREIVLRHGITNPDVVRQLPTVVEEKPKLAEEWLSTGAVYVQAGNDGDGEQIPLRRASTTDVRLALGDAHLHTALRQQDERDKWRKDKGFEKLGDPILGNRLEVIAAMMDVLAPERDNARFRCLLFKHIDEN